MIYIFDEFEIDTSAFEIRKHAEPLPVEPQVLDLLILLVKNHTKVLSRDELFSQIWAGKVVSDTTLSSCIKSVRKLLGDDGTQQRYIRTIHGRGFRFVGCIEVRADTKISSESAVSQSASLEAKNTTPIKPQRPATQYAKSGDIHVAYQVFGAGSTNLVLAPGFVSHIDNYWDHPNVASWLTALGSFARVAMFDKRGTGLSDQVSDLPGMDERMDDVRAVMDAAGFERAAIMGISEGGSLAALFAATHPKRCQALILYGSFSCFTSWFPTEESLQALFDYIETQWGTGSSLSMFAPTMGKDPAFTNWWGKYERLGANPGAAIALMRMNSKIDLTDILPSIRSPTLVIHRVDDVVIDVEGGLTLAANIPNAKYVELSGVDHIPWVGANTLDIPAAVRDFLSDADTFIPSERVLATILVMEIGKVDQGVRTDAWTEQKIKKHIEKYRGGELLKMEGHYVVTFDGPARALHCARDMVLSLKDEYQSMRIGLHTGEVEIIPSMVSGLAVQLAGGIAQAAMPLEVLVSRTVNDLVAGSGITLVEAETRTVDGMPEDWLFYRIDS